MKWIFIKSIGRTSSSLILSTHWSTQFQEQLFMISIYNEVDRSITVLVAASSAHRKNFTHIHTLSTTLLNSFSLHYLLFLVSCRMREFMPGRTGRLKNMDNNFLSYPSNFNYLITC
jgi:hypothetical protein